MKKAAIVALVSSLAIAVTATNESTFRRHRILAERGPKLPRRELEEVERRDDGPRRRELRDGPKRPRRVLGDDKKRGPPPPKDGSKDGKGPPKKGERSLKGKDFAGRGKAGARPERIMAEEERPRRPRGTTDDAELKKGEEELELYCTAIANSMDCARTQCASKALNATGWSARDEYWAAYFYQTADYSWEIFKGLLVSGFEWEKVEEWIKDNEGSRSLSLRRERRELGDKHAIDDVLVEWARPFAQFCYTRVSGFNLTELPYFMPMRDNKDFWGAVSVTSTMGVAVTFIDILKGNKWNFEDAKDEMLKGMEEHCHALGFAEYSWIVTALSNDYYTVVEKRLVEALWDILNYEAEKAGLDSDDLPTAEQMAAGAKQILKAANKDCKDALKEDLSNAKKCIRAELKAEKKD